MNRQVWVSVLTLSMIGAGRALGGETLSGARS
jgi:hypothetical protein